jgi:hypothetical protein
MPTCRSSATGVRRECANLRHFAAVIIALLAATPATPAAATEGGGSVYPYGLNTLASGVLPKPGHYLYFYNLHYAADVTRTNSGDRAPVPFDVEVRAHTVRYLRSLQGPDIAGGRPGLLVALPYLVGSADIGPRSGRGDAFGDATVGVMLGWNGPRLNRLTGVDFTLPTGSYDADRLFNPGRNQYAATVYYAVTAAIGSRLDANLRAQVTLNGENDETEYESGTEAGLEYSLNLRLGPRWLVGLNGFVHHQLTDDVQGGATVAPDGRRLHAVAYGPQVAYRGNGWGIAAKWQREAHARNRAEGDRVWLQFFVGL